MSKKTEQAVVRATMRWFKAGGGYFFDSAHRVKYAGLAVAAENACHAHAKSLKGKR